jgi:urea transport system ATP-binding protein
MRKDNVLEVRGLSAGYGQSRVLHDVDLSVAPGQAVCILGRNGVGKTTLLKTIVGLLSTRDGTIRLDEQDVTRQPAYRRARRGIGYVPQGRGIFPDLSVFENLLVGFEARPGMRPGDRAESLDELCALFPMLAEMRQRAAGTLSGGQQQQLAIARGLAARPRLLVLDEPTEGIQPSIVDLIEEVLSGLPSRGVSVLLVEQFVDFALAVADTYHVLDRGTIVASGDSRELSQATIDQYLAV